MRCVIGYLISLRVIRSISRPRDASFPSNSVRDEYASSSCGTSRDQDLAIHRLSFNVLFLEPLNRFLLMIHEIINSMGKHWLERSSTIQAEGTAPLHKKKAHGRC